MIPYRQAVTAEEFEFGLRVTEAASQMRGPYTNPESYPGIPLNDGSGQVLKVKDTGLARGTFAVLDQFGAEKGGAIFNRIMNLLDMLHEPELADYVRNLDNPEMEFHPALIPIAATLPFTPQGAFDKTAFLDAVKKAVAD